MQELEFYLRNILPESCKIEQIIEGRLLKVTAKYEKITLELINVYAPVNASERMIFRYAC